MSWEIKDNEGVVKAKVNALEYNDEWMGQTSVTVTVESPEPIDFAIGNYLVYRGERFEINYDPGKIKSAPRYAKGDAFKYENIKFNSLSDELTRCDFLDVVLDDNQIHYTGLPKFTFFGTVQDFANRIKANLDRAYPGMWTVVVSPDYTETKELNISVDNQKVWNMLETIVNDFKVYFTTKGRTITIGASGVPADHIFTYGKGNGLYEIEQNAEADQAIVTRLRAYGSDRNIPRRYYQTHFSTDWCVTTIHAVTERDGSYHFLGKKRCKLIFTLIDQYVDKTKCVKDSGGTYWFAVKIHGKTYAAAFDGTSNSYQIGTPPPVTVEGVSNITLRKSEMEAIEAGTEISFTAFVESAPGIIRGQHIPDNMAINNLMLPGFPEVTYDPYIDSPNIDALGIREGTIFFDGSNDMEEIFPSIEGMTAEQLKEAGLPCDATGDLDVLAGADQMTDTGEGEVEVDGNGTSTKITPSTFRVTVKDLGFDINDYVIPGNTEKPTVSFKDGKLGGRDFEIVECSKVAAGYELELNRVYDEDIKLWFPYKDYNAKAGDKFVLLHIGMPDVYIKAASQRLLKAAQEWLAKNDYSRSVYAPKVDEIFMARQHDAAMASGGKVKSLHDTLCAGMMMLFEDSDLNIDASIFIDRLTIKEEYGSIPTYEVTLKEEKSVGRLDKMQNQIDSLASGVGSAGYSAAQIRAMISAYGDTQFLSKLHSDRTAYRLAAGLGFQAGDYKAGESGAQIDAAGNAEVESLHVRSWLKVQELIYNRLNAQEGDTSFGDVGTIEQITNNSDGTQTALMRMRWEGDFTAFQPGDVVYGYVNKLDRADAKEYYKAWAWVKSVDRAANQLVLATYPDSETPAGKNHPMTEGMVISRWGNNIEPSLQTYINPAYSAVIGKRGDTYINKRQRTFFISCDSGNLVELMGVNKPKLEPGNYGTILGIIPDGLLDEKTEELINKDQPYLFARGIIVQDLIRVGYEGVTTRTANYRGIWSAQTASSTTDYYRSTPGMYDTVTWNGALWQCVASKTLDEPKDSSAAWVKMTASLDDGKEVRIWTINPSANIVSVRKNEVRPERLSATVTLNSSDNATQLFTNNYDLLLAGAKIFYSTDGVAWQEFIIGQEEPLDLEDETGVIELEDSTNNDSILTVGGNDISTADIGDRIYFELRDANTGDVLNSTQVPVVKDGTDGITGDWTSYAFKQKDSKPDTPTDTEHTIPSGWQDAPTGTGKWWMSKATIDGTTQKPKTAWSEPVQCTAEDGKPGQYTDFKYEVFQDGMSPAVTDPTERHPTGWKDTPDTLFNGYNLWMIQAEIDCNNKVIGTWSKPVRISGEKGQKGDPGDPGEPGDDGRDGLMVYPAGYYDPNTTYTATGETAPVVMYAENYYVLRRGATYKGASQADNRNTPALEVANTSADTSRWILFDKFNAVFADIVMADFAKLGSAVFCGDWLISQQGTLTYTQEYRYKTGISAPTLTIDERKASAPSGWSTTYPTTVPTGVSVYYITAKKCPNGALGQGELWSTPQTTTAKKDSETVVTTNSQKYQEFKSGAFEPNYSVNFKTGEINAGSGTFSGYLKTRFIPLSKSDALAMVDSRDNTDGLLIRDDVNILSTGKETGDYRCLILLPSDIKYAGTRVTICDFSGYSRSSGLTHIRVKADNDWQDGIGGVSISYTVDGITHHTDQAAEITIRNGVVELLGVSSDFAGDYDSDNPYYLAPYCKWFVLNNPAGLTAYLKTNPY